MQVKLFDAMGRHTETYAVWDKGFERWIDEASDAFFEAGGYAELWNDRDAYRFSTHVQGREELRRQIRAVAA